MQIILTHEHADAVLGLDDIRAIQPFSPTNDINPTPIHLTQFSMDSIAEKFPYLVEKKLKEGQEVMHGEDYISLGFLFGEVSRVAYVSDVSRFPASTEYVISKTGAGQLDLLILDTLYKVSQFNLILALLIALVANRLFIQKLNMVIFSSPLLFNLSQE
ncbi:hypothetical protein GIB67_023835 [Kingdonia uniflora]|uniref:Metallo-beta-lactamase domain-containing protein n=1 Tax=Kingdonia uniflora TaxID=39325 RepID=A0A7J7NG07_9MAGN|nr:hypothetical protein GIB67_023835 [Kingdonia uniflora]